MAGKKGMDHYPVEMKLEAVRLFFEEGWTHAEITQELGIRSSTRVKVWVRQYRREGEMVFSKPIGRPRKQADSEQAELERLRMENALLKKFHTELRTQVLAKRNIGSFTIIERSMK
jgi:transposase-like protein